MIDHVALLVPSLESALERVGGLGLEMGAIEDFPGEGTREVYLGPTNRAGRLLLMQPLGHDGAYAQAFERRGAGLHHIAFNVEDVRARLENAAGWLLHPKSLRTWEASKTVWLARPGIGTLLELHEAAPGAGPATISIVEVPAHEDATARLAAFGLQRSPNHDAWLHFGEDRVSVEALVGS